MSDRDARLRWIAKNIRGVSVSFNGSHHPGGAVEPGEIVAALHELLDLRAAKARNWRPRPGLLMRWWMRHRP